MIRFLLDTNVASFLTKGISPPLMRRFRDTNKSDAAISTITEAEMRFGLALLPSEAKVWRTVPPFLREIAIEPWDSRCATRYAELAARLRRTGHPMSAFDTMIAAHALAYDFTLVTNDKAFARIKGLRVEDWTKGPQRA
ncbi:type II toxin-antitoxin system VapC family toxin [Granulicella sp. 5B5]|uniref:type II toxin-antitoxin system VapC family toxin n=1 Tax=Granulicella sp. 5B5 TaxID=1617967 RepID=UPI0015F70808|nr:type II toxin-antitoxin system VapC family toxin [Granulicella sp. 5B5]